MIQKWLAAHAAAVDVKRAAALVSSQRIQQKDGGRVKIHRDEEELIFAWA